MSRLVDTRDMTVTGRQTVPEIWGQTTWNYCRVESFLPVGQGQANVFFEYICKRTNYSTWHRLGSLLPVGQDRLLGIRATSFVPVTKGQTRTDYLQFERYSLFR